ncbi:MAG: hypothetical protein ACI9KE_004887 [Polyangiales bacterium]|jgi:hypothetical protein
MFLRTDFANSPDHCERLTLKGMGRGVCRESLPDPARSMTHCTHRTSLRENREIPFSLRPNDGACWRCMAARVPYMLSIADCIDYFEGEITRPLTAELALPLLIARRSPFGLSVDEWRRRPQKLSPSATWIAPGKPKKVS